MTFNKIVYNISAKYELQNYLLYSHIMPKMSDGTLWSHTM